MRVESDRLTLCLGGWGLLNKQIAFELATVEKTVKVHRVRVMEKNGNTVAAELLHIADRVGFD